MKQIKITTDVTVKTFDELTEIEARLVDLARQATYRSYVPYSDFHVGAAILLDNGEIVTGSNQENAAFPSGTCAERTACFYAGSTYPDARFDSIAISARDASGDFVEKPVPPCGACRQALLQYETIARHDVKVILAGRSELYILPSVKSLLPLSFTNF